MRFIAFFFPSIAFQGTHIHIILVLDFSWSRVEFYFLFFFLSQGISCSSFSWNERKWRMGLWASRLWLLQSRSGGLHGICRRLRTWGRPRGVPLIVSNRMWGRKRESRTRRDCECEGKREREKWECVKVTERSERENSLVSKRANVELWPSGPSGSPPSPGVCLVSDGDGVSLPWLSPVKWMLLWKLWARQTWRLYFFFF